MSCRHHFYVDVDGKSLILNFPGRHVDEIPETCSLRAARAVALKREASERPDEPALSCAQIGKFMNLAQETIRLELQRGLAKLKAAGVDLGDSTKKGRRPRRP